MSIESEHLATRPSLVLEKAFWTAERYWNRARRQVEKYQPSRSDNYRYITSIVRKRLGVNEVDLALCGAPVDVLLETLKVEVNPDAGIPQGPLVNSVYTIAITEFAKISLNKEKSSVAYLNEDRDVCIRRPFLEDVRYLGETWTLDDLRKLFPGIPDGYLKALLSENAQQAQNQQSGSFAQELRPPFELRVPRGYKTWFEKNQPPVAEFTIDTTVVIDGIRSESWYRASNVPGFPSGKAVLFFRDDIGSKLSLIK